MDFLNLAGTSEREKSVRLVIRAQFVDEVGNAISAPEIRWV